MAKQHEGGDGMEPVEDLAHKQTFTTGEAAAICKVSQQTIIRCFDKGQLQGFRVPGSKFRRIPREELMRFMRSNGISVDELEGAGKKRVLVVDDDPRIVDLFEQLLNRDGRFEVKTAMTGYDAGMLTEAFRPHLMILDYMLPDINGNVVCKRVREKESLKSMKVLCVSGVINEDEIQGLMSAGADAFLQKPFNIASLLGKIVELLELEDAGLERKLGA